MVYGSHVDLRKGLESLSGLVRLMVTIGETKRHSPKQYTHRNRPS